MSAEITFWMGIFIIIYKFVGLCMKTKCFGTIKFSEFSFSLTSNVSLQHQKWCDAPTEITTGPFKKQCFFGFLSTNGKITDEEMVICRICEVQIKYHSTTSDLRSPANTVPWQAGQTAAKAGKKHLFFASLLLLITGGYPAARQQEITDRLTRFICKDMTPINISQESGFKDFVM